MYRIELWEEKKRMGGEYIRESEKSQVEIFEGKGVMSERNLLRLGIYP